MSTILAKFKQNITDDFISSLDSPVRELVIEAQGAGYANGDTIVFTGDGEAASGKVWTDAQGRVTYTSITEGGRYVTLPNVSITTANGFGAVITPKIENDHFYLYAGRSKPFDAEPARDPNYENDYDSFFFQYEQMLYGKKISNTDVAYMARVVEWKANTVFVEYDDKDRQLPEKDFYVLTTDNHVFKCITNNSGAPSLIEPANTQPTGLPTQLADGYRWKYLYSITGQDNTKFKTPSFMPVKANANVAESAIDGGVLNIKVEAGGTNYPAFSGQVSSTQGGNIIVLPSDASSVPNFYANCTVTVFGAGNAVTNRRILSSGVQGNNKIITVASNFNANQVNDGYQFSIAPSLVVTGDGSGFEGFLKMNATNRSVIGVEIVDPGSNYHQATAVAIAGTGFGSGAKLRAVIAPRGGHGSDVYGELYCKHMGISGEFANTLGFPVDVTIRTVGILKNPQFANGAPYTTFKFNQTVTMSTANTSNRLFTPGETIIGNASQARGQVAFCNTSQTIITGYIGTFIPGEVATGQTSNAQLTINALNNTADLKMYSGDVVYLQNISPTPRNKTSSEQIKLIIKL
jgi:hypothetical protein